MTFSDAISINWVNIQIPRFTIITLVPAALLWEKIAGIGSKRADNTCLRNRDKKQHTHSWCERRTFCWQTKVADLVTFGWKLYKSAKSWINRIKKVTKHPKSKVFWWYRWSTLIDYHPISDSIWLLRRICSTKVDLFTSFSSSSWLKDCRPQIMVTGRQRWLTIGVVVFLATLLLINTTHRLTISIVVDNFCWKYSSWQYCSWQCWLNFSGRPGFNFNVFL